MNNHRADFTHNWVAKELSDGKYRSKAVKLKTAYQRVKPAELKSKEKYFDELVDWFIIN